MNKELKYMLFYTGLASYPFSIGVKCLNDNSIVCNISINETTSKLQLLKFNKFRKILNNKFKSIL